MAKTRKTHVFLVALALAVAGIVAVVISTINDPESATISEQVDTNDSIDEEANKSTYSTNPHKEGADQTSNNFIPSIELTASDPRWAARFNLPDEPQLRIPQLIASADQGSTEAAEELYMLTWRCAPWQPVPRTETELDAHKSRIIQKREGVAGDVLEDQERALIQAERIYALCSYFDHHEIPGVSHWIEVAADLGSYQAMVGHWQISQAAHDYSGDLSSARDLEQSQEISISYFERARDEGYVDAFFAIGAAKAEIMPGPYEADKVGALAHFYAEKLLRVSLFDQRIYHGVYEKRPDLRELESARLELVEQNINRLESMVPVYQHEDARKISRRLIQRCCM